MWDTKNNTVKRYLKNEDGNFATAYALSAITMVMAIGAGYDIGQASGANKKAQNIADAAALSAAVFYSANNRLPETSEEAYMHDVSYDARTDGHKFHAAVKETGQQGAPTIKVTYDEVNKVAVAQVNGETAPNFLQIFGLTEIKFNAKSEVTFAEKGYLSPATVMVAVDGSGSMQWDDKRDTDDSDDETSSSSTTPGAVARIEGLKTSLTGFMDTLKNVQGGDEDVVRTGMYVYNSDYSSSRSETTDWGALSTASNSKIDNLYASGGTNASAALEKIRAKMVGENTAHEAKHGNNNPLKFVILMTDGVNSPTSQTNCRYEDRPAHDHWIYWSYDWWWDSWYVSSKSEGRYKPKWGWSSNWEKVSVAANTESKYVCDDVSSYDATTKTKCDSLAALGTKIYTIAYGLEPGYYHRRDGYFETYYESSGFIYDGYHIKLPEATRDRAYGVMEYCANVGGGDFVPAEDAAQLNAAFENIGEQIVQEIVRIKS